MKDARALYNRFQKVLNDEMRKSSSSTDKAVSLEVSVVQPPSITSEKQPLTKASSKAHDKSSSSAEASAAQQTSVNNTKIAQWFKDRLLWCIGRIKSHCIKDILGAPLPSASPFLGAVDITKYPDYEQVTN